MDEPQRAARALRRVAGTFRAERACVREGRTGPERVRWGASITGALLHICPHVHSCLVYTSFTDAPPQVPQSTLAQRSPHLQHFPLPSPTPFPACSRTHTLSIFLCSGALASTRAAPSSSRLASPLRANPAHAPSCLQMFLSSLSTLPYSGQQPCAHTVEHAGLNHAQATHRHRFQDMRPLAS